MIAPMEHYLTAGEVRALHAVHDGLVRQRFDAKGNVFEVPKGVSAAVCRRLQAARLIEDEPGAVSLPSRSHHKQRLTDRGRRTLAGAGYR